MIPFPVAPLKGVTVLVTRPDSQAHDLCSRIVANGGEAVLFPVIAIEAVPPSMHPLQTDAKGYDWLIFVSANAVKHGLSRVTRSERTRIAAIGKSTAAALAASDVRVDAVPDKEFTSEALLGHPAFSDIATQSVLIVKGEGGRELLQDVLTQRGARTTVLDVYRRLRPPIDATRVMQLEERWRTDGIDIVTLTSVETLDNLLAILTEAGRALAIATPFITLSERIVAAARAKGFVGSGVVSRGADDASIIGAIAAWHGRAR